MLQFINWLLNESMVTFKLLNNFNFNWNTRHDSFCREKIKHSSTFDKLHTLKCHKCLRRDKRTTRIWWHMRWEDEKVHTCGSSRWRKREGQRERDDRSTRISASKVRVLECPGAEKGAESKNFAFETLAWCRILSSTCSKWCLVF